MIKDMKISITDKEHYDSLITKVVEEIKANPKLMSEIEQKAKEKNKTFEQAIIDDAKWIVNHRMKKANIDININE